MMGSTRNMKVVGEGFSRSLAPALMFLASVRLVEKSRFTVTLTVTSNAVPFGNGAQVAIPTSTTQPAFQTGGEAHSTYLA